ncbi:NUDIX hydrolase [bacterium]|nr:NUDIX hydrolase [bacterium]
MEETVLARQTHFKGRLLQLDVVDVELADGSRGVREVVYHPNAVCAAVLTRQQEWVFVRQFRLPAEALLLEVTAGKIDAGEDPDQAILRELREEIGYQSGQIHRLMEFWSTPGFCNERMTCYVVSDAQLGNSALDEGEFLEVVTVSAQEGLAMALDGRLADAKSVAAILAWARFLGL